MFFRPRVLLSLVAVGLLAAAPAARADDPRVQDIVDRAVPTLKDGTRIPIGEVQRALLQALIKHRFDAEAVAPGHIVARYAQRRRSFEVDIHYTETAYSVRYKSGRRVKFDAYNERLALLGEQVDEQFEVAMQRMKRIALKQTRRSLRA
jgi:hypothetical protein